MTNNNCHRTKQQPLQHPPLQQPSLQQPSLQQKQTQEETLLFGQPKQKRARPKHYPQQQQSPTSKTGCCDAILSFLYWNFSLQYGRGRIIATAVIIVSLLGLCSGPQSAIRLMDNHPSSWRKKTPDSPLPKYQKSNLPKGSEVFRSVNSHITEKHVQVVEQSLVEEKENEVEENHNEQNDDQSAPAEEEPRNDDGVKLDQQDQDDDQGSNQEEQELDQQADGEKTEEQEEQREEEERKYDNYNNITTLDEFSHVGGTHDNRTKQELLEQEFNRSTASSIRPKEDNLGTLNVEWKPFPTKLPKPIFNVGFQKAGTSTIFDFFHCNGLKSQHWFCCEAQNSTHPNLTQHKLMSSCILHNLAHYNPILQNCGDFEVYAEINGPRWDWNRTLNQQTFNWTPNHDPTNDKGSDTTKGKRKPKQRAIILDDGSIQRGMYRPRILLPQHHYLDKIHEQYPNATFILNLRPLDDWVQSVMSWNPELKLQFGYEFFLQQTQGRREFPSNPNITDLPMQPHLWAGKGIPNPYLDMLRHLYDYHSNFVRNFVRKHPSHTLIEVDISQRDAGKVLADSFGLDASCWGHSNKRKEKSNETGKG